MMTDQQLALKFAEKVLGWHKRKWSDGVSEVWVDAEGVIRADVDSNVSCGFGAFTPCTDLNQAMLGVNTKTHQLLLESPLNGGDEWVAILVAYDNPQWKALLRAIILPVP